jgi:glycosyltransferase involved in cell wall biosynthesis
MMVNDHLGYAGGVVHGPARWFKNILPCFDPSSSQVELVILGMEHPFAAELARVGVRPLFLNRSKWDPRALIDLIGLIRRHRIDILHVMGMKSIILGRIATRYAGCKVVVHFHDTQPVARPVRFVMRRLSAWSDLALSCAPAVAEMTEQDFAIPKEKSLILLNAIRVHEFSQERPDGRERVRAELGIGSNAWAIGMIGRLSPMKGHELALRAMTEVLARHPDVNLVVVGHGEMRPDLEELARELRLERTVIFTGQREDIPDVLAALDLVMFSSLREGHPLACLEAIAAAKPVVAFDIPGPGDIVKHGETGLLVRKGDVRGLAEAITATMDDRALYERMVAGCKQAREGFGLEQHLRKLEELWHALRRGQSLEDMRRIVADDDPSRLEQTELKTAGERKPYTSASISIWLAGMSGIV